MLSRDYWRKHGLGELVRKRAMTRRAVRRGRDLALNYLGLPSSMTRTEATVAGVRVYYTGKRCGGCGKLAPRYTSTGGCVPCRAATSRRARASLAQNSS